MNSRVALHADRHGADGGLVECLFEPARCFVCDFGIEDDIEVRRADPRDVCRRRAQRRDEIDLDAQRVENLADLDKVIAVAEAQGGGAENIGAACGRSARAQLLLSARWRTIW